MNIRTTLTTMILTLSALAGISVFTSGTALAAETYGLEGSFGSASSTTVDPEPLSEPGGVAVNSATGEVYVADEGNARIERFSSTGAYISQFSMNTGPPMAEPPTPEGIAVDNSTDPSDPSAGDVYVADISNNVIDKFTATGIYVGQLTGFSKVEGIAVSLSGDLWVKAGEGPDGEQLVDRLSDAIVNSLVTSWAAPNEVAHNGGETRSFSADSRSIAVDSADDIYLTGKIEDQVTRLKSSQLDVTVRVNAAGESPEEVELEGFTGHNGLAVETSDGDIFVLAKTNVEEYSPISDSPSIASLGSEAGLTGGAGIAVRPGAGVVYVADSIRNRVDIFGLGVWPEGVSVGPATGVTNATAIFNGGVNPNGATVTSCRFEYGSSTSFGQSVPCAQIPVGGGVVSVDANVSGLAPNTTYYYRLVVGTSSGASYVGDNDQPFSTLEGPPVIQEESAYVSSLGATVVAGVNSGGLPVTYSFEYGTSTGYGSTTSTMSVGGSSGVVSVSTKLEGLHPETTYHFRVIATNAYGSVTGSDATFTTHEPVGLGLPDGRGFELVSPVASADGNVYLSGPGSAAEYEVSPDPVRATADGDAVEYVADPLATGGIGPYGEGTGSVGAKGNEFVATRGADGWSTMDLDTPGFDKGPLEALISNELANSGTSSVPAGTHSLGSDATGLFDVVGGRSIAVSVLPAGQSGEAGVRVSSAVFGGWNTVASPGGGSVLSHVVSADGSRIFWTDLEDGPDLHHLFVRENGNVTVPVSVGAGTFWTASVDGRYAFYTEKERLWRFDVETGVREELAGRRASVLGVIGVNETGEDGAYVYFVANGVLGNGSEHGAVKGECAFGEGASGNGLCNIYVLHNGEIAFIAALAPEDFYGTGTTFGGEGVITPNLGRRTAEVSADGQGLVFISQASPTGYANSGNREVYVYEAGTDSVSCVSCSPTGPAATSSGLPLSSRGVFMHRWISENGSRVFFETSESLVAQDTNGAGDVYEWETDGTGSCGSVEGCVYLLSGGSGLQGAQLLDASASGNDVFIVTRGELVAQDQGETRELYDVRVGASEPPQEPVCTGTGCQGLPAGPPLFATPSSVTFNGVGNFSPATVPVGKTKARSKSAKCPAGSRRNKSHGKCIKLKVKTKRSKAKRSTHGKGSK